LQLGQYDWELSAYWAEKLIRVPELQRLISQELQQLRVEHFIS